MLGLGLSFAKQTAKVFSYIKDKLKAYYRFYDTQPDFLLDGSTSFDGTNDYISMGNVMPFSSGGFSFGCWVMPKDSGNGSQMIISKNNNTDGYRFQITNSTKTVQAIIEKDNNHASVTVTSTTALQNGEWYHILITYDGATSSGVTKLYINGQLEATNSSGTGCDDSGGDLQIGRHLTSSYYNGLVSNAGFWSRELSASEVESIYWRGSYLELQSTELTNLVSWYDLSSTSLGSELVTNGGFDSDVSGWTQTNLTATYDSGTAVITNQETANDEFLQAIPLDEGVGYEVSATISNYSAGTSTVVLRYDNTALTSGGSGGDRVLGTVDGNKTITATIYGTSGSEVLRFRCTVTGSATNYTIDNVSVKAIQTPDAQGSNEGNIVGATVNSDSYSGESPFKPRIQDKANPKMAVQLADGSTDFDGSNDYIDLGDDSSLDITSNISLSMWVKFDSGSATQFLMGRDDDVNRNFELGISSNKLFWNIYSGGVAKGGSGLGSALSDNVWYHITATYDGSNLKTYVNGSLDSTNSGTGAIDNDNVSFTIGAREGGMDRHFNGKMANVAIHSSALTQSQIQELMFTEKYSGLSSDLKTNLVSWYDLGDTSLGSELITNGGFDTTDDWAVISGTWVIEDGVAKGGGGTGFLAHGSFTQGKLYSMTFTVKDYVSGSVNVSFSDGTLQGTNRTANGTYTEIGTVSANNNIYFKGTSFNGSIDDVSIKEVQATDSEGTNEGSIYGATTNTGYTYSPHGVVDPLNFGEVYSGRALSFDGVNDGVTFGQVDLTDEFTISSFVWWDIHGTDMYLGRSGGDNKLGTLGTSNMFFRITSGGSSDTSIIPPATGQWHHVVLKRDSSDKIDLYINGVKSRLFSDSAQAGTSSWGLLGVETNGTQRHDGKINNVKIFDTDLSDDQVRELYTKPETVLPTGVSASNLKLDLPMQGGSGSYIYDGSGNQNHGTISGASWVSGQEYGYQSSLVRSNTPMIFDGSNDIVNLGSVSSLDNIWSGGGTLSAWIFPESDGGGSDGRIAEKRDTGSGWTFTTREESSGSCKLRVFINFSSTNGVYTSGADVTINAWNHVVVAYDSSGAGSSYRPVIYINGSVSALSATTDSVGTADSDASQDFTIGGNKTPLDRCFDGLINEVAIWDVALDADAISALYNSGVPLLPTSDSGNYDNSDSLVLYQRNDGNTTWTDRANTGVASFDGIDDRISLGTGTFNIGKDGYSYSISAWFKAPDQGSNDGIFSNHTSSNEFQMLLLATGRLHTHVYDGSTQGQVQTSTNDEYNDNQWHHVVSILDSSADTLSMYVDGSLIGSTTWNMYTTGSLVAHIGSRSASTNYFEGQIAGTHVFDVALTASEVSELYAIDKRSSISGHSQFSNCVASYLMGAGDGDSTSTIQDQTSNNNDGTVNGASLIGYNDGTASGSPVEILIPEGITSGRDNQGYYLSDTTTISNGIRLHGSEYIEIQDSEVLSFGDGTDDRPFSIETWVKIPDATVFTPLVYKYESGKLEYRFVSYSGGVIINTYDNSATAYIGRRYATALTAYNNQWVHLVSTYSGNGANNGFKIYLNGSQIDDTDFGSGSYVAMENLLSNVEIGRDHSTTYSSSFHDEVRIYSKELSADEVTKNYNNGKSSHQ